MKKQTLLVLLAIATAILLVTCKKEGEDKFELPTISTLDASEIGVYSAKSGGSITNDGGSPVTERGVVWSTNTNPTIAGNKTTDGSGTGSFTSLLTGLSAGTDYFYRAYATNEAGTAYGSNLTFSTPEGPQPCPGAPTVTDIDGNIYQTVIIGDQCWIKENLKTTRYRNGTSVEYLGDNGEAWVNNTSGAYAWYNNDITWKDLYGALYNWHAVNSSNGLCPEGWHVPTDAEWTQLADYIVAQGFPNNEWDLPYSAGNAIKSCRQVNSPLGGDCTTTTHPRWDSDETHFGFDDFGFSALPGGYYHGGAAYGSIGEMANWWGATTGDYQNSAFNRRVYGSIIYRNERGKAWGFSVRCIRD